MYIEKFQLKPRSDKHNPVSVWNFIYTEKKDLEPSCHRIWYRQNWSLVFRCGLIPVFGSVDIGKHSLADEQMVDCLGWIYVGCQCFYFGLLFSWGSLNRRKTELWNDVTVFLKHFTEKHQTNKLSRFNLPRNYDDTDLLCNYDYSDLLWNDDCTNMLWNNAIKYWLHWPAM